MTLKDIAEIKVPALLLSVSYSLHAIANKIDMGYIMENVTHFFGTISAVVGAAYITWKFFVEYQEKKNGKRSK